MYVVGYPKSGNTWLCYLLAYCLNAEYDDLDDPGIHPQNSYQRKFVKGGLPHPSYQYQVGRILKTHSLTTPDQNADSVIYLVRDGRDVMVSYYYYQNSFLATRSIGKRERIKKFLKNLSSTVSSSNSTTESLSIFLHEHTVDWVYHVQSWLAQNPRIVIKYEDLKLNPQITLEAIFQKLNAEVSSETIQRAIDTFSFERLSARQSGKEDNKSFYRKGIVGDWKHQFSPEDMSFFRKSASSVLKALEYEV